MYSWSAKTTIHGMDPGWKENPTPYQSPDPSPTYTETARSPVYYESSDEVGSERSDQVVETFGSPTYSDYSSESPRAQAWSSPTYDSPVGLCNRVEVGPTVNKNLNVGGWKLGETSDSFPPGSIWKPYPVDKVPPMIRIKQNGKPSRFDVEPDEMEYWKAVSSMCARKLEELKEETRKTGIKGEESDRHFPYRHQEHRKHRDSKSRRRRHEDHRSRREDRRQRSSDDSRRDRRYRNN